ncbi:MAG TPA: hypothetical protein VJ970_07210, partial [Flavobacteriaceae bacterium]|nr:hypothetical protein [Flavobacteriaceae bacterium]
MKKIKLFFILLLVAVIAFMAYNYKRLNIITGFSAKSVCSCAFEANRSLNTIEEQDNGFSPINLASNKINSEAKQASSSVFGLKKRTAVYKSGIGCILLPEDFNEEITFKPNRYITSVNKPYPYGSLSPKDTILLSV